MCLAHHLHKTLKEIQETVTMEELILWQAFQDEYLPFVPQDLLTAQLCTVLANINHVKGRRPKIKDFLWFRPQKQSNKEDSLRAWVMSRSKKKKDT